MPKTLYKLFKILDEVAPKSNIVKHYFCKNCHFYYSNTKPNKSKPCNACKSPLKISVFFEFDIAQQLRHLLEKEEIYKFLKNPNYDDLEKNEVSDITDGTEYFRVNFSDKYKRKKFDLTLITNTDGLQLKKRSLASAWPLMSTIAEIHEKLRSSFVVIGGIWCDEKKPEMNVFLQPFCKNLKKLFEDGFLWTHKETREQITSRVIAPLFILDAPARAYVHNRKNFKSKFGCDMCEIKTTKSPIIPGQR